MKSLNKYLVFAVFCIMFSTIDSKILWAPDAPQQDPTNAEFYSSSNTVKALDYIGQNINSPQIDWNRIAANPELRQQVFDKYMDSIQWNSNSFSALKQTYPDTFSKVGQQISFDYAPGIAFKKDPSGSLVLTYNSGQSSFNLARISTISGLTGISVKGAGTSQELVFSYGSGTNSQQVRFSGNLGLQVSEDGRSFEVRGENPNGVIHAENGKSATLMINGEAVMISGTAKITKDSGLGLIKISLQDYSVTSSTGAIKTMHSSIKMYSAEGNLQLYTRSDKGSLSVYFSGSSGDQRTNELNVLRKKEENLLLYNILTNSVDAVSYNSAGESRFYFQHNGIGWLVDKMNDKPVSIMPNVNGLFYKGTVDPKKYTPLSSDSFWTKDGLLRTDVSGSRLKAMEYILDAGQKSNGMFVGKRVSYTYDDAAKQLVPHSNVGIYDKDRNLVLSLVKGTNGYVIYEKDGSKNSVQSLSDLQLGFSEGELDQINAVATGKAKIGSSLADAVFVAQPQSATFIGFSRGAGYDSEFIKSLGGIGDSQGMQGTRIVAPGAVYDYLMTLSGMTDIKAKAIIINMNAESSFRLNAADGTGAHGLFQYMRGRYSGLQSIPNWDSTNWRGQINYALGIGGSVDPNGSGATFRQMQFSTLSEAATWWNRNFEVSADTGANRVVKFNRAYPGSLR